MVEFMADKVGQEFDGHISGMSEWGIVVELEDSIVEGMVAMRDIVGDYYRFDEARYEVYGHSTGNVFTLGDKVRVTVIATGYEVSDIPGLDDAVGKKTVDQAIEDYYRDSKPAASTNEPAEDEKAKEPNTLFPTLEIQSGGEIIINLEDDITMDVSAPASASRPVAPAASRAESTTSTERAGGFAGWMRGRGR